MHDKRSVISKYPEGKNEVKIIQEWDWYRPSMSLLTGTFHAYLVDQKIKEDKLRKRTEKRFGIKSGQIHSILWIETLLQTQLKIIERMR